MVKFLSIVCSYNTPEFTKIVHHHLERNEGDILILDNSSTDTLIYKSNRTVDLGRKNIFYGGMVDFILNGKEWISKYDYIGILNNDISLIPENMISEMKKTIETYTTKNKKIGSISPCVNEHGTGYHHMRKLSDASRELSHIENICAYYHKDLLSEFSKYVPTPKYGWYDNFISDMSRNMGMVNVILDNVMIHHMLSGTRKKVDNIKEYCSNAGNDCADFKNRAKVIKTKKV